MGQVLCLCVTTSTPKNLPPKNLRLRIFVILTFKKRGTFGIAQNHGLSLANAKEKISKTDLTLILVCLLKETRTYFSKNGGTLPSHAGSQSLLARMTRQKS